MSVSRANRPRRRRVPRAEREELILAAATRLFAERGYHGVAVDEVAAAAGITKPMVYAYFGSKEGVLVAAAHRAETGLLDELERSADEHTDPAERVWNGLLIVFRFIERHGEAWKILYPPAGHGTSPVASGAASTTSRMVALIRRQMHESVQAAGLPMSESDMDPFAHAFVAATIAVGSWWLSAGGEEPAEAQALRVMNLTWQGMGDLLQGRLWLPPA